MGELYVVSFYPDSNWRGPKGTRYLTAYKLGDLRYFWCYELGVNALMSVPQLLWCYTRCLRHYKKEDMQYINITLADNVL